MSLRVQAVSSNHESRPLPRDTKKFGLLKRLASSGISCLGRHSHNSDNSNRNYRQYSAHTHGNSAAASMVNVSSCNSLKIVSVTSSRSTESLSSTTHNHQYQNSIAIPNNDSSIEHMAANRGSHRASLQSALTSSAGPLNIMHWMQNDCPEAIVPLVLAFAGPQRIATIGRTNRFWRQVIEQEATWRRLCESLYKWEEGDDVPDSWKKYYQYNPCVPVDYSNIHTAVSEVTGNAKADSSKPRAIRVLLRPGYYILRKAITIDESNTNCDENFNINNSVSVAIETMVYSPGNRCDGDHGNHSTLPYPPSDQTKQKIRNSIRNLFRCRTVDVENEDEDDFVHQDGLNEHIDNRSLPSEEIRENPNNGADNHRRINRNNSTSVNRATLVLASRHHNEPLLRVRQGSITMRNIDLKHVSFGNDIWNGNSAIQIEPALGLNNDSSEIPAPMVTLDCVDVTSSSGRGIVNIDGGHLKISNSLIHDCAATGIYVGGSGSRATIEQSDVIYNGRGNNRHRRGIGAGHSGIYLEQGHASIVDCNISRNTLTGISAISRDNALLSLQESDLVSNGTFQLEMPDVGSATHRNSVTINNNLASSGRGRYRSVLLAE